jgi:hypothetical protein
MRVAPAIETVPDWHADASLPPTPSSGNHPGTEAKGKPLMRGLSLLVLRLSAVLVFAAGLLHLLMTGHLMRWFRPLTVPHADVAQAAMLLNHVVVGILLLPLAVALAAVGPPLARGEPWAFAIGVSSSLALLTLPVLLMFTFRSAMLDSPAFVAAGIMLALASVAVTTSVAHLWLSARKPSRFGAAT